jgi:hypothetical protein
MPKAYHPSSAKNSRADLVSKILLTTGENVGRPQQVADLTGWINIQWSQQRTP